MIKKLIDTDDYMFIEVSGIKYDGLPLTAESVKTSPYFPVAVLDYIKQQDAYIDVCIEDNPGVYDAIIFPMSGNAYAAIFPMSKREQACMNVCAFVMEKSKNDLFGIVYAYDFDELSELERFIESNVITRTDDSALFKFGGIFCYVTSEALSRLSEFFINERRISRHVLNEHGDVFINENAYEKLSSYLFGGGKTIS
jgi:hypothetical protein